MSVLARKTRRIPEVVYTNQTPQHAPTLAVVIRGQTHELMRGSSYFEIGTDRYGRYRIRRRSAVYLHTRQTGTLRRLWDGVFTMERFRAHPEYAVLCAKLGCDDAIEIERGQTLLVG